tara:strand:- start:1078 stop:1563 length:486 start_codon:yes stop_codon:yes gene_type:complete
VCQARQPVFYEEYGVADTPDGRFDSILLHVFLLLRRLKGYDENSKEISQAVFDTMFKDMDQNLREMGVGDMGVSSRIKDMAKAFYGRIAAYEKGLDDQDNAFLESALSRNLYRQTNPEPAVVNFMAEYVRGQEKELAMQKIDNLLNGSVHFSTPPSIGSNR